MDDPLLSSLCTICHINVPKYTCPRCSVQTCSLPCSRRHKLWSSCNGVRDPTVFKPISQLATPSGIDHDYNFLHSIEHGIERSEKEIIEDRRLVGRKELQDVRRGEGEYSEHGRLRAGRQASGEECIDTMLKIMGTRVHKAPKGMRRNVENTTSWNKTHRHISWQVEWMQQNGTERVLGKILGNKSIEWYYDQWCEEERRIRMNDDERRADKKRKGNHYRQRQAKKARIEAERKIKLDLTATIRLQDPETSAWDVNIESRSPRKVTQVWSPETYRREYNHQLYLLRPLTTSNFPKVLAPIDPTKGLTDILRRREVLEFPTIFVFEDPLEKLPDRFMLEQDYLTATGQAAIVEEADISHSNEGREKDDDDDTSNSSIMDEGMEDGEIVEQNSL